ncbi:MAG TPA: serine hydrolase domain-containing protein [Acidimicrobiia bacterium]|nr:serine hydrolase domain-containing protein [Acidimicrobiia bacterium]
MSSSVDVAAIESFVQAQAATGFSGVVAVRERGREVVHRATGIANRAANVPVTSTTRFDVASIAKLMTATAAMQLIERGEFALDTSMVEFLGLEGDHFSPLITPHHLLSHTSGIGDDADEEAGERYEDLFVDKPNYQVREASDQFALFATRAPNFAPGDGTRYCNSGFVMLGLMIEKATGMRYRDYVVEHVFRPAQMTGAGWFSMDLVEPDVAEGVEAIRDGHGTITGWQRNIYCYPPIGGPDGGVYVTANDLFALHDALTTGTVLGPASFAAMRSPQAFYKEQLNRGIRGHDNGAAHYMGYGFECEVRPDGSVRSYWKEGINFGASACFRVYPELDVSTAVLAVGEDNAWDVTTLVDASIP